MRDPVDFRWQVGGLDYLLSAKESCLTWWYTGTEEYHNHQLSWCNQGVTKIWKFITLGLLDNWVVKSPPIWNLIYNSLLVIFMWILKEICTTSSCNQKYMYSVELIVTDLHAFLLCPEHLQVRAVTKFWFTGSLVLHTCSQLGTALSMNSLNNCNFIHNVRGKSSIISHNRCYRWQPLMTALQIVFSSFWIWFSPISSLDVCQSLAVLNWPMWLLWFWFCNTYSCNSNLNCSLKLRKCDVVFFFIVSLCS